MATEDIDLLREWVNDNENIVVFFLNRTGEILTWNRAGESVLGWTPLQIIGESYTTLFPADANPLDVRGVMDHAALVGHSESQSWKVTRSGERIWTNLLLSTSYHPDDHSVIGYLAFMRRMPMPRAMDGEHATQVPNALSKHANFILVSIAIIVIGVFLNTFFNIIGPLVHQGP